MLFLRCYRFCSYSIVFGDISFFFPIYPVLWAMCVCVRMCAIDVNRKIKTGRKRNVNWCSNKLFFVDSFSRTFNSRGFVYNCLVLLRRSVCWCEENSAEKHYYTNNYCNSLYVCYAAVTPKVNTLYATSSSHKNPICFVFVSDLSSVQIAIFTFPLWRYATGFISIGFGQEWLFFCKFAVCSFHLINCKSIDVSFLCAWNLSNFHFGFEQKSH